MFHKNSTFNIFYVVDTRNNILQRVPVESKIFLCGLTATHLKEHTPVPILNGFFHALIMSVFRNPFGLLVPLGQSVNRDMLTIKALTEPLGEFLKLTKGDHKCKIN